jgi:HNH endonuclease
MAETTVPAQKRTFNRMVPIPLTAERAHEHFKYDPETGIVKWRRWGRGRRPDLLVGVPSRGRGRAYSLVNVDGGVYLVHRIIYLLMLGHWPPDQIDHINGDGYDNRWANLRPATPTGNAHNRVIPRNNTSGIKGVHWSTARQKWVASICLNYKTMNLGGFATKEEAAIAYAEAAKVFHGEFASPRVLV